MIQQEIQLGSRPLKGEKQNSGAGRTVSVYRLCSCKSQADQDAKG